MPTMSGASDRMISTIIGFRLAVLGAPKFASCTLQVITLKAGLATDGPGGDAAGGGKVSTSSETTDVGATGLELSQPITASTIATERYRGFMAPEKTSVRSRGSVDPRRRNTVFCPRCRARGASRAGSEAPPHTDECPAPVRELRIAARAYSQPAPRGHDTSAGDDE